MPVGLSLLMDNSITVSTDMRFPLLEMLVVLVLIVNRYVLFQPMSLFKNTGNVPFRLHLVRNRPNEQDVSLSRP